MLPVAAAVLPLLPLSADAWSSFSTKVRTSASRAGLAARKIRALLRGSASKVVLNDVSAWPTAAPPAWPESIKRVTNGARSVAIALRN